MPCAAAVDGWFCAMVMSKMPSTSDGVAVYVPVKEVVLLALSTPSTVYVESALNVAVIMVSLNGGLASSGATSAPALSQLPTSADCAMGPGPVGEPSAPQPASASETMSRVRARARFMGVLREWC